MFQTTPTQISTTARPQPSIEAIKAKMKATWMDGEYARFARYMEPGARQILSQWIIAFGERLLDVGCGSGQIAIPAASAGVQVTGIDIAGNLVENARQRAASAGLDARFDEGDAERLPYRDGEFDVVVSLIGAMFAPRPDRVAAELARVCRPGGRLLMANWTPTSMPGWMFKRVAEHVPPPPDVPSPALWGDEDRARERLADSVKNIQLTRKFYPQWVYPFSVTELVEYFRLYFGPVRRAFAALDETGRQSLREALELNFAEHNLATDGTVRLSAEYLEVAAIRR
jgi:ubiquinone/menaquinone biosynthesis C-methylase UbiE